jgi:hypothetical protein
MWENSAYLYLFNLDLLTIMIAYLFLLYGGTIAATFAFGQGFLIDLFSGGLDGLFALLYLSVFGGIYLGSLISKIRKDRVFLSSWRFY